MKVASGTVSNFKELDGYQLLSIAIVTSAARDYRKTYRQIRYGITDSKSHMLALKRFFDSEWYRVLTPLSANYLMDRIEKEVNNEVDME